MAKRLGIVMNGVTGRMGYRQHLVRSILAIREQGGVDARRRRRVLARADPRRPQRARSCARSPSGTARPAGPPTSTRRSPTPDDRRSTSTPRSPARARSAMTRGDRGRQAHLHREADRRGPRGRARAGRGWRDAAGVKNGVVQDKLFLPGLLKLKRLVDGGFFGRILSVRGEFGYWVFEGDWQAAQRPSWNYRAEDGGGIVARHVPALELRAGEPLRPGASGDRARRHPHPAALGRGTATPYAATADDAAYGDLRAGRRRSSRRSTPPGASGSTATSWSSSRSTAPHGSAVAGPARLPRPAPRAPPRSRSGTPTCRPPSGFRDQWQEVPGQRRRSTTASRPSGSSSSAHVVEDAPYPLRLRRRRPRRAARRGRAAVVGRGPPDRRCRSSRREDRHAGAPARRSAARAPAAALRALTLQGPVAWPRPPRAGPRPRRLRGRARGRRPARRQRARRARGARLGRHARVPPPPLVATAAASPTRWTPRSAAWAWTGPPPAS